MLPGVSDAIACLLNQMDSVANIDLPIAQNRVEYCAVCGDQADGYHYGVLSCRGCNAFFRRAVTHNLQFQCRRGGNCVIDRNARCACRACRLNACKLAGMDRSAVQLRRDSEDPAEPSSSQLNSQQPTSSTSAIHDTIGGIHPDGTSTDVKSASHSRASSQAALSPTTSHHQLQPTTTSARAERRGHSSITSLSSSLRNLTPPLGGGSTLVFGSAALLASTSTSRSYVVFSSGSAGDSMGLLAQMVEDYFDQRRRRRSMLCTTVEGILNDGVEEQCRLREPADIEDFTSIYRTQMILMFEWVERLKEFQLIKGAHDRVKLIRAFAMKYLLLDNITHTLEMGYSDRLLLVNNTFVQPIHPTNPLLNVPTEYGKAISILHGENCARLLKEILHPMIRMQLTFGEIMAMRLLVFFNPQHSLGLSEEANESIHAASERTLQELHGWYAENHFDELKQRLSNLLLLLSPLMRHSQHLSELASLIPDFGMPEWDSFMNELLR